MKMRFKSYLVIAVMFIAGCDSCKNCYQKNSDKGGQVEMQAKKSKGPAYVRIDLAENQSIVAVQQAVKPLIDQVIAEEYKREFTDDVKNIPSFMIKSRLNMSLYYIKYTDSSTDSFFTDMLSIMQRAGQGCEMLQEVYGSDNIDFFGDDKNELVIKVDDRQQSIYKLHDAIKHAFKTLNNYVKDISGGDLIDFEFAEKHAFVPHVSIGKIVYSHVNDADQEKLSVVKNAIRSRALEVIKSQFEALKTVHIDADSFKLDNSMHKTVGIFPLKKM